MKNIAVSISVLAIVIAGVLIFRKDNSSLSLGSIQDGQAYTSTSTASNWGTATNRVLKVGYGTLGSVVITAATGGGVFELRNATSTIDPASTTLATFTAGAIGGTYTFDVAFDRGLAVITTAGLQASTTITFR